MASPPQLWSSMPPFATTHAGETLHACGSTRWSPLVACRVYAARAGTTTRWSFGDDESQLGNYAWYRDNAWNAGLQYAQPVGTKLPNPWGLYDMHGNVIEWCQDKYGDYYASAQIDPQGPYTGSSRVIRGGSFNHNSGARYVRSAIRNANDPDDRTYYLGFRVLRED